MKLLLIDGIGPFFQPREGTPRLNWSKVPFADLERDGQLAQELLHGIRTDFQRLVHTAAGMGFTAITVDDVAHLAQHPDYPPAVAAKIESYRALYAQLFAMAAAAGLRVFVTTDILFTHASTAERFRRRPREREAFLADACRQVLDGFPQVAGIIARLGECDGVDVEGDFRSSLAIRTPRQARALITGLLPLFAERDKLLVMRTWTVGAYPIGDLIWHRDTFRKTFHGIDSPHFVISMKYGESDFFRYLPLNAHFFRSPHQKIIELQARREYEGFGEYPSFIGWDYENILRQLASAPNVIGAWIWCQTGGWSRFDRITFLRRSSIWNEINTWVALKLAQRGCTTEAAVESFCRARLPGARPDTLLALLRLSDEVIRELLYIEDFARCKLFFRRLRVPTLLAVYWDCIIVNHDMRKLMRCFVADGEQAIRQGWAALRKIRVMQGMAAELGLPAADLAFQYDTFEILAVKREFYFGRDREAALRRLLELKARYHARYPLRYAVKVDVAHAGVSHKRLSLLLRIVLRRQRGYRLLDRLVLIRLLSWLSPLLRLKKSHMVPPSMRHQAMGLGTVLR